jgi:hypothetical protein
MNHAVPSWHAENTDALRRRFPELASESFLFEVTVGGHRFMDSPPPHKHETHGIAEGVCLVRAYAEKLERLFVKGTIHPDDFQTRMDEQPGRATKGRLARDFPDLGKGHEFGQDVAMREMTPFALEETLRLCVLGLVLGKIAK